MHIFKHIPLETVLGGMHYYLPYLSDDSSETQERETLLKSTKVVGSTAGPSVITVAWVLSLKPSSLKTLIVSVSHEVNKAVLTTNYVLCRFIRKVINSPLLKKGDFTV